MTPRDDQRRADVLTTAIQVFSRYGFKKTSMDEVARAVGLSRQGLYLHFPSKEALFTAAVTFLVDQSLTSARAALAADAPLDDRLVGAFVAMHGAFVGSAMEAAHLAEMLETARQLAGDAVDQCERAIRDAVTDALRPAVGARAAEIADLLDVISTGAKHRARTAEEYAMTLRRGVQALVRTDRG